MSCDGLGRGKFEELAAAVKAKCPIPIFYAGGTAIIEILLSACKKTPLF
ncbi:MAG: hypothetical protein J7L04_08315 [Bacteroidales bacterium]|nr:hypothetical protein [Bacteroidales bacterium]